MYISGMVALDILSLITYCRKVEQLFVSGATMKSFSIDFVSCFFHSRHAHSEVRLFYS